jgi:hypothetical protein
MPDEAKGAKVPDSPDGKGANEIASPPIDELLAENKRKAEEIKSLKSEHSQLQTQLKELEKKVNLTTQDKKEKKEIEKSLDDVVAQIESNEENQGWLEAAGRRAQKTFRTERFNQELETQNKAIKREAKARNMSVEDFEKELDPYAKPYKDMFPLDRFERAMEDFERVKGLEKREADIAKKEAELNLHREPGDGGGQSQTQRKGEKRDWKKSSTRDEQVSDLYDL